jgi:MFS family permease
MTGISGGRRPPAGSRSAGKRVLLVILCAVQFIDAYDIAAMGPVLPKIQHDLGMPPDTLQWVVSAYVLGYGGFLLLGGRLADLFDRKRLLIGALLVFTVASVAGGVATVGGLLIAARLAKGITAAFTAPASLAILLHTYEDEGERNKALGAYLSIAAVGFTSGLVLGGLLATVTWRLVLLIPAGLALILLIMAGSIIPRPERRAGNQRQPVDLTGAIAVTAGLLALVYGVSRAPAKGWGDSLTVGSLAAAGLLLTAFLRIERVRRAPLVPLEIFTRPGVSRGNAAMFLLQGSYVGWQFVATLYLQNVHHWSPVEVGLIFAPGGVMVVLTAQRWAGQVTRLGSWLIASAGMLLMLLGYLWTLELGTFNSVLVFGIGAVVNGTGYAMAFPATNISAVSGAHPDEQGLASGLFIAAFQVGSGVILGIVASVFTAGINAGLGAYRLGIAATAAAAALSTVICLAGIRRRPQRSAPPGRRPGSAPSLAAAGSPDQEPERAALAVLAGLEGGQGLRPGQELAPCPGPRRGPAQPASMEKYRSPVSGNTVTIVAPAHRPPSLATRRTACAAAPEEMPTSSPVDCAI